MKIAAAQINPTVGDIQGNVQKILTHIGRAKELGAQIVLFPEMCIRETIKIVTTLTFW